MAPGGRRTGAGMQSHAYCLSALYEGVDAISTKDGMVNEAVSEHTHILPYSPIALIQLLNFVFFADLVVMAERLHPIPFRTRP